MRVVPIYSLSVARDLIQRGFRLKDVNINNQDGKRVVFFFYITSELQDYVKRVHNLTIK